MPSLGTRILLFLSSFPQLLLILGIRKSLGNRRVAYILFGMAALSILGLLTYFGIPRSLAAHEITIQSSSSRNGEAMSYIVTRTCSRSSVPVTCGFPPCTDLARRLRLPPCGPPGTAMLMGHDSRSFRRPARA